MNINMNLVCEHHELSLSDAGLSGSLFLVVHEQPQFHEHGSGNSGWQFMNVMNVSFVVQEHSLLVHDTFECSLTIQLMNYLSLCAFMN